MCAKDLLFYNNATAMNLTKIRLLISYRNIFATHIYLYHKQRKILHKVPRKKRKSTNLAKGGGGGGILPLIQKTKLFPLFSYEYLPKYSREPLGGKGVSAKVYIRLHEIGSQGVGDFQCGLTNGL